MNDKTTVDELQENHESLSSSMNRRASRCQLLTKIYYPDTLYPDSYSFFADRTSVTSTQAKSSLIMDENLQYPVKPMNSTDAPTIISTLSKQSAAEAEAMDQKRKYAVS